MIEPDKRVLVVEDEVVTLMLVADDLRSAGFDVVEAERGDDALTMLQGMDRLDALVTNYRLPGADGVEVAIFARGRFPTIPVIFISATSALVASARAPKPYHRLDKPFETDELVRMVTRLAGACSR